MIEPVENGSSIYSYLQPDFGILFDVDGVLARGSNALDPAVQAMRLLADDNGHLRIPIAFVTNATNRSQDKAAQIQKWFGLQVRREPSLLRGVCSSFTG